MQKKKLILGLTLSSILVLSGTAMAFTQGHGFWKSTTILSNVKSVSDSALASDFSNPASPNKATKNRTIAQLPTNKQSPEPASATESTAKVDSGSPNSPYGYGMMGGYGGSNGNGGYGMMGGYGGSNGNGGYGMMGGYGGSNGNGGYGMMGGYGGPNGNGGYGMMGGYGGPNGNGGYGMMGGESAANLGVNLPNGQVENFTQAIAIAKTYVQKFNSNLAVDELHEFSDSYEVELEDAKTGEKAYEFAIAKQGGVVFSEMGPNIMWNTKYGHMNLGSQGSQTAPTVSAEQAAKIAQAYVAKIGLGYTISEPETAPGYYEFMILKDGKDFAELDVNGYSGQVWYENWHGPILNTIEAK